MALSLVEVRSGLPSSMPVTMFERIRTRRSCIASIHPEHRLSTSVPVKNCALRCCSARKVLRSASQFSILKKQTAGCLAEHTCPRLELDKAVEKMKPYDEAELLYDAPFKVLHLRGEPAWSENYAPHCFFCQRRMSRALPRQKDEWTFCEGSMGTARRRALQRDEDFRP